VSKLQEQVKDQSNSHKKRTDAHQTSFRLPVIEPSIYFQPETGWVTCCHLAAARPTRRENAAITDHLRQRRKNIVGVFWPHTRLNMANKAADAPDNDGGKVGTRKNILRRNHGATQATQTAFTSIDTGSPKESIRHRHIFFSF
jgi:hypothetical protein